MYRSCTNTHLIYWTQLTVEKFSILLGREAMFLNYFNFILIKFFCKREVINIKKVIIVSAHKSYDYRIERHIKSLLKIGKRVIYYNITNEENIENNIQNANYEYKPIKMQNKKLSQILRVVFFKKELNKNVSDYIFIQDELLLILVPFIKNKRRIVFDIHEIPEKYSGISKLLFRYSYKRINENKITALKRDEGIFMDNYSMLSDFVIHDDQNNENNNNTYNFIYSGMITEENRHMIKTLEVFDLLLFEKIANEIFLIGPLANRINKDKIEEKIKDLQKKYANHFFYYGKRNHDFVVSKWKKSDFSLFLIKDTQKVSPNKLFESMISGTICVTDHLNYSSKVPENLLLLVDKKDSPEQIVHKIQNFIKNNNIKEIQKDNIKFILENQYYWERFLDHYKKIFK